MGTVGKRISGRKWKKWEAKKGKSIFTDNFDILPMQQYNKSSTQKARQKMAKKEYTTPQAEKLTFEYSEVVTTSKTGGQCIIGGMSVSWSDTGNYCSSSAPGDE